MLIKDNLGAFLRLVVVLALIGWFWGAHRQASERSCVELNDQNSSFVGGIVESITRGWDWPIYWLNGTTSERIPCKGGGQYIE